MRRPRKPKPVKYAPDVRLIEYARVSTAEQSLELQIDALKAAGVIDDDLHVEKVSGAASKRPRLDWALTTLREGDTFVVWRLDRLARNMIDLLTRLQDIEKAGAKFKSLSENFDTTTATGRLVLNIMGAFAQFERDIIIKRTRAGMRAARERGIQVGQPRALDDKQTAQAQKMRDRGVPVKEIAAKFKVAPMTIYTWTHGTVRPPKRKQ